ncbi:Rv2578c family radical SAM protein [soil metagenome]
MARTLADLQRDPKAVPVDGEPTLALRAARTRTFDTPEFAGITFHEVEAKSALNRVRGMPFGWSLNLYRGCGHACSYCFARPTHAYLNLSPLEDFEREIVVKTNVVEVLRRELAKPSWRGEHVALGTNTDPYQRCEGRYRLMPGVIEAFAQSRTPFSILTKGTLVTRDIASLRAASEQVPVAAALTIGMLDEDVWRSAEPGTPSPKARLEAVRALNDAGIPTGVMLAPIMPGLNDSAAQLAALVDACAAAGAVHITPITLHLRPGVKEVFWPWLEAAYPELVPRYRALYRGATAPKAFREPLERFVADRRRAAWRQHGRPPTPPGWRGAAPAAESAAADEPVAVSEQLSLL